MEEVTGGEDVLQASISTEAFSYLVEFCAGVHKPAFQGRLCGGLRCRPGPTDHRRTDELPSPLPKSRLDSFHVGG